MSARSRPFSSSVRHKEDWSSVSFDFAEDFLAKTDVPYSARCRVRTFVIPAISSFSESEDLKLCPVRALRAYLKRTKTRRKSGNRLFVPILGDRLSVSKNTISAWISATIRHAYEHDKANLHAVYSVSAHEVRALSTSWQFAHNQSLEVVMAAASWRSHSTFSHSYLRDLSSLSDKLYALGPIIAAQSLVSLPTSTSGTSHPSVNQTEGGGPRP